MVFFCSFLKNKLLAVMLGVTGVGLISQLSNFVGLLNFFVPLGLSNGLTKFVAEKDLSDSSALTDIFSSTLNVIFYPTIIFTLITFLFADELSIFLLESAQYSSYIRIIAIAIPFLALNSLLEGFLKGLKKIKLYVRILIITNLINIAFVAILIYFYGITGGVIAIITSYILYVIVSSVYLKKSGVLKRLNIFAKINRKFFFGLAKVSLAFLVSGALFQLALLIMRKIVITEVGLFGNGIFQSVIGISLNYFGFIFLTLSTYSFPTVSKMEKNEEIVSELNINVKYILMLMVPLIILLYVFRVYVISFLFSNEFSSGQSLFKFQFPGDLFKGLAWAIGVWIVPRMKLRAFVIIEIILNINLIFILSLLNYLIGARIEWVSVAYLGAYIVHFLLTFFYSKSSIGYSLGNENWKLLLIGLFLICGIMWVSHLSTELGYYLLFPCLIAWGFISLKKSDIAAVRKLIFEKIGRHG